MPANGAARGTGAGKARAEPKRRVASRSKAGSQSKSAARAKARSLPEVRLGRQAANGISASMFGLVERGAAKRPRVARSLRGTIEIRFKEDFAPVRVEFSPDEVLVEDAVPDSANGKQARADLVISGSLPDIVQLASAPLFGGVPRPTNARGRAALASFAGGRVRIEGSPLLARRLLKLLEI